MPPLHPHHLRGSLLQVLLLTAGAAAFGMELPVLLAGPSCALVGTGPHTVSVLNPLPGVSYQWTLSAGGGELTATDRHSATFITGKDARTVITCHATHSERKETGSATHSVRILEPGSMQLIALQAPLLAGPEQPLVAWVNDPPDGLRFLWDIEGGRILGPADQPHIVFRSGTGERLRLLCTAIQGSAMVSRMSHTVVLLAAAPQPGTDLAIEVKGHAASGKAGVTAAVVPADESKFIYHWSMDGGKVAAGAGAQAQLTPGAGASDRVRCLAINRSTGAMTVVEREIRLWSALEPPTLEIPARIFAGQTRVARISNLSADEMVKYEWHPNEQVRPGDAKESKDGEGDRLISRATGEFPFRADRPGLATLTCRATHMATEEQVTTTREFEVLAPRPLLAPAAITDFKSHPASPLRAEVKALQLTWNLDQVPDRLVLREAGSGREWPITPPNSRSLSVPGPFRGRLRFTLTSCRRDPELVEDSCASATLDLQVPGISVLAGAPGAASPGYMATLTPGLTPWSTITGLAWKAPWLYFSQGTQHTIRRIHLTEGVIEEVAGMRGIPGNGLPRQDLLCEPGPLIHRSYTAAGGAKVEDWLVLQPGAHRIQSFTEGKAEASMKVLVGSRPREAKETKEAPGHLLKQPMAMAVHAATGFVLVADTGNQAIKLYSADGEWLRTLETGVEAFGIAVNDQGDVFFTDTARHVIKRIPIKEPGLHQGSAFGPAEVFAGAQDRAGAADGGRLAEARFRLPMGLAIDGCDRDSLLVADTGNNLIRSVPTDPARQLAVETIGGDLRSIATDNAQVAVHPRGIVARIGGQGRGILLATEDAQESRTIELPEGCSATGITFDRDGNLFLADPSRHVVWALRLQNPPLTMAANYAAPEVFAGALDRQGRDEGRRIAGPDAKQDAGARLGRPETLSLQRRDPGILVISDPGNQLLWEVPTDLDLIGEVKQAGKRFGPEASAGNAGFQDGPPIEARFSVPSQVCSDSLGRLFVLDQTGNGQFPAIRVIDAKGGVTTLGGIPVKPQGATSGRSFDRLTGIAAERDGGVLVADSGNRCLRRIGPDGRVTVAAGSGQSGTGNAADDGPAREARFDGMGELVLDARGRVLVLDPGRRWVRLVDFRNPKAVPPDSVSTLRSNLPSGLVCGFPASAAEEKDYVLAFAEPLETGSACTLKLWRKAGNREEVIAAATPLQALCADRSNRIWTVLPPDPAAPGVLQVNRYRQVLVLRPEAKDEAKAPDSGLGLTGFSAPQDGRPGVSCSDPEAIASSIASLARGRNELALARGRYALEWQRETLKIPLEQTASGPRIDGRSYAPCAAPRITGMACDSHDNVFLADSGNGLVWKLVWQGGESSLSRVAGAYPYLGPIGTSLDSPLMAMQGIAVTREDDVLVTCGDAVLRIVPETLDQPEAWKQRELFRLPETKRVASSQEPAKPARPGLGSAQQEQAWQVALKGAEDRFSEAQATLARRRTDKLLAEQAFQCDPGSLARKRAATTGWDLILAAAQNALDLAKAERDAKLWTYRYLLDYEKRPKDEDLSQAALALKDQLAWALPEAEAAQAQWLLLRLRERARESATGLDTADQARLTYVQVLHQAKAALADRERKRRAFEVLHPKAAERNAAKAAWDQAKIVHEQLDTLLERAAAVAKAFEAANRNPGIYPHRSWAETGFPD